jgi:hypothetical protein
MLLDPCLGPAKDEERKGESMGLETANEVEDSNLNIFLVFCVLPLHTRFPIRIDTLVDSIDDDEPIGHSVESGESLEWFDNEFDELKLERDLHNTRLVLDCGFDMRSELRDILSELVHEGDDEPGWRVALR